VKPPTALLAALLAAQRDFSSLHYSDKGPRGEYVSVDSAVAACRQVLHQHGLILFEKQAHMTSEAVTLESVDRRTGEVSLAQVTQFALKTHHVLAHPESGESEELNRTWPVHVSKGRAIDHAVAAASSFGITYLLRGLLMFPRGDHDTSDRHQPHEKVSKARIVDVRTVAPSSKPADAEPQAEPDKVAPAAPQPAESGSLQDIALYTVAALKATLGASITAALKANGGVPAQGLPEDCLNPQRLGKFWSPVEATAPTSADLCTVPTADPLGRPMLRDLHVAAVKLAGKELVNQTWSELGVTLSKTAVVTGYVARLFAVLIGARATN